MALHFRRVYDGLVLFRRSVFRAAEEKLVDIFDLTTGEVNMIVDALLAAHQELTSIASDPNRMLHTPDKALCAKRNADKCLLLVGKITTAIR